MKVGVNPQHVFVILLAAYAVVMTNFSYAGFTVTKDSFALGALALTLVMAITTSEK